MLSLSKHGSATPEQGAAIFALAIPARGGEEFRFAG
jgi:hypothetical protein